MNYYISDLHFGWTNKHEGRTLEHDQMIIDNWNRVVTNADKVFILGDIGKEGGNAYNEYLCKCISVLKGNKYLIQGNHDKLKDARLRQLFVEIVPYKEILDNYNGLNHCLALSHYPIMMFNGQHKGWVHLYGHLHTTPEEHDYQEFLKELDGRIEVRDGDKYKPIRAYNVGCMMPYMDYTPRTLKEILENENFCKKTVDI